MSSTKTCEHCKEEFSKPTYNSKRAWEKRRFCSISCSGESTLGDIPWNKGKKRPEFTNEGNPFWKGDKVSYTGIHKWVARHLGKPDTCKHCNKSGLTKQRIHWANISREYKRELSDWIRLCAYCHKQYDKLK